MRQIRVVMVAGALAVLMAAGCHNASQSGSAMPAASAAADPGSVATDSRIPPERRAALEGIMAQQQAGAQQMGARMKAAAQRSQAH